MSWKRYERRQAKRHRGRHIGGPGKEDYRRGKKTGEVKHLNRPMTKAEVMNAAQKGIAEIVSLRGFTQPAIRYVKRYRPNLKLFRRGRRVN